jgi:hypothetical protein
MRVIHMKSVVRIGLDEKVKAMMVWWFQQPREFFMEGICLLVCKWDACPNAHEDYFNDL